MPTYLSQIVAILDQAKAQEDADTYRGLLSEAADVVAQRANDASGRFKLAPPPESHPSTKQDYPSR